jgi:hypothetical protein
LTIQKSIADLLRPLQRQGRLSYPADTGDHHQRRTASGPTHQAIKLCEFGSPAYEVSWRRRQLPRHRDQILLRPVKMYATVHNSGLDSGSFHCAA